MAARPGAAGGSRRHVPPADERPTHRPAIRRRRGIPLPALGHRGVRPLRGLACGHDPFPRAPADALLRLPANACRNGLQIRQDALDRSVLDVLAGALDAEVIAEAVEAAVAELRAGQVDAAMRRVAVTRELEAIATRERLRVHSDGDVSEAQREGARVCQRRWWPQREPTVRGAS